MARPGNRLEAWEVVRPASAREAVDAVRRAGRSGLAVVPWGSGSHQRIGVSAAALEAVAGRSIVCQMTEFADARELAAENLTATFEAGCTLAQVDATLAEAGLWLPVEPGDGPGGPSRTIGGVIASGGCGPRRLGYGRPRDWLLGVEMVTAAGELVPLGGKTVKNVTGYDLVKLMCGSWGQFGLITAVTVRVAPRPRGRVTLVARYRDASAAIDALLPVLRRPGGPVAAELIGGPALMQALRLPTRADDEVALAVMHEGEPDDLPAEVAATRAALQIGAREWIEIGGDAGAGGHAGDRGNAGAGVEADDFWERLRTAPEDLRPSCRLRAGVPPDRLGAFLRGVDRRWAVVAHAGNGIARLALPGPIGLPGGPQTPVPPLPELARTVEELRHRAEAFGGYLRVEYAPPGLETLVPYRAPRLADAIGAAVRRALDPDGRFSPHR